MASWREFTLGDRVIKGNRIGVGEAPDNVEATLDHYRVGTTVPVYYDPKNPENALLERSAPPPTQGLYAIAAGVFLVGLLVLSFFLEHLGDLRGTCAILPGQGLPAGHGLLHPWRGDGAGDLVGIAPAGR